MRIMTIFMIQNRWKNPTIGRLLKRYDFKKSTKSLRMKDDLNRLWTLLKKSLVEKKA